MKKLPKRIFQIVIDEVEIYTDHKQLLAVGLANLKVWKASYNSIESRWEVLDEDDELTDAEKGAIQDHLADLQAQRVKQQRVIYAAVGGTLLLISAVISLVYFKRRSLDD